MRRYFKPDILKAGDKSAFFSSGFQLFNRLGVAAAVLKTPLSLIHYLIHPLKKYLQDTFTPKPKELGT